ncbi:unnamed protein product [Cyclocybe aegerita]|uniref:DUF6593 domain-containing protein n=1 Tax=Cyclocybe aegerita TaxID=1973307 RepID=A0A8S0XFI3_CYCAE|nr:unnamed protein product [Cyclocybe aegerita]
MQLCLVDNDPTATLLVSSDGEPMYAIETPPLPHATYDSLPARRRPKSSTTTVKRLSRYHQVSGPVEKAVGVVEYLGEGEGTCMQLCTDSDEHEMKIGPCRSARAIEDMPVGEEKREGDQDNSEENSWVFMGPDSRKYKWQLFLYSPVSYPTGTIPPCQTRDRVAFTTRLPRILPLGLNILDLIIVTFVAFMKQRVLVDGGQIGSVLEEHVVPSPSPVVMPPMNTPSMSPVSPVVPPQPKCLSMRAAKIQAIQSPIFLHKPRKDLPHRYPYRMARHFWLSLYYPSRV